MTLSRRKTLALVGGGAILAATGAFGYSVTRPTRSATLPWQVAGQYEDPRVRALSWAILAPNAHNRQPWKVDLSQPDAAVLYVDTDRLLPQTDPFSRQITIGLGCFLEVMGLAAAEDGFALNINLFPEGESAEALDTRPVALIRFVPDSGVREAALFQEVRNRRSLKEPYDMTRPVADRTLNTLRLAVARGSAVDSTNGDADVRRLRALTVEAFEIEFHTPRTYRESLDLFRIGRREIDANPDGIDLGGPMFETLSRVGLFTRAGSLDPGSMGFRAGLDMVTEAAQTGMAYVWLVTQGNSRTEQIIAGRDWVRLNLAATAQGLGVQPMSQALQEFPEMAHPYAQAHEMLAPGGGTVQMLGRLGYGPDVAASPRWPLEAKLRRT